MPRRSPAHPLRSAALLGCVASASAFGPAAHADTARRFVHTTEADFEPGEPDGFSVTAYGELVPVPAFEELPEVPEGVETLLALARVGGDVFAAGGTADGGAKIVKLDGDAWEEVASIEEAQVFCLLASGDTLLVGVSADGGESRVAAAHRRRPPPGRDAARRPLRVGPRRASPAACRC